MIEALGWNNLKPPRDLNNDQLEAVKFGKGPLWIIAGPGSGKSEVLVWRTLKLILVDDVTPKSIILTTFTEKAGNNLQDRIMQYIDKLIRRGIITYDDINVADIKIGTLHSICINILQEMKYDDAQNKKLMNEVEQSYFVYRFAKIVAEKNNDFWSQFTINP